MDQDVCRGSGEVAWTHHVSVQLVKICLRALPTPRALSPFSTEPPQNRLARQAAFFLIAAVAAAVVLCGVAVSPFSAKRSQLSTHALLGRSGDTDSVPTYPEGV